MAKQTNWTKATTDVNEAMIALISCVESGRNAWIEVQKNGEQGFPIQVPNPLLDDPFNWTPAYGVQRNEKEINERHYLNQTEEDLTRNWTCAFGTAEAVKAYQKNRTISKDLFVGCGVACPVRIEDANRYRHEIVGDDYKYDFWTYFWQPNGNISYWVPADIDEVFVVCYDYEPVKKSDIMRRAAEFMTHYADELDEREKL